MIAIHYPSWCEELLLGGCIVACRGRRMREYWEYREYRGVCGGPLGVTAVNSFCDLEFCCLFSRLSEQPCFRRLSRRGKRRHFKLLLFPSPPVISRFGCEGRGLFKNNREILFPRSEPVWLRSSFDRRAASTSQLPHFNFAPSAQVFLPH